MKKLITKLFIVITSLLLTPITVSAQIENEISSFSDSTDILVNNGRKLILQSIAQKKYQKATELYHYLNDLTIDKGYSAFDYVEALNICLLTSNWNLFFEKATHYQQHKLRNHWQW